MAADIRAIRKAIEESDSGYVSVVRKGERRKWDDAKVLYADYKEHDQAALRMVYRIRDKERTGPQIKEIRHRAEEGDLTAIVQLHMLGRYETGEKDMARAIELLETHEPGFLKSYRFQNMVSSVPRNTRERYLLSARVMHENYRFPGQDDAAYAQMTLQNEKGLATLKKAAAAGDPDAVWVVEQLAAGNPAFPMP